MVCKQCKTKLQKHAYVCPNCGALTPYGIYCQKEQKKSEKSLARLEKKTHPDPALRIKRLRILTFVCFPVYLLEIIYILVVALVPSVQNTIYPQDSAFHVEPFIAIAFFLVGWILIIVSEFMHHSEPVTIETYLAEQKEKALDEALDPDYVRSMRFIDRFISIFLSILLVALSPIIFPFDSIIWLVKHRFD